jgi:fatty-acyl-CoA synthase
VTTFRGPPLETEEGIGALTLPGFLSEVTGRYADRQALVFRGEVHWTYSDLWREARRVTKALMAAGLQRGARVALLMGNRPEWVASAYGAAMAGAVLVPLNTYLEPPELDYVLSHSDATFVLMQRSLLRHQYLDELLELCPELERGTLSARFPFLRGAFCIDLNSRHGAVRPWEEFLKDGEEISEDIVDAAIRQVTPADDALIIYTSGTTAKPKGVLHAHRAATLQAWRYVRHLRLDQDVRSWTAFPFFWSAGFAMGMGGTLAAGGCLVLQEYFEPGEALRLFETERVTTPNAWPHQIAQLVEHPDWETRDLSSLRHIDPGTALARQKTVHLEQDWSARSAYGVTETFTIITSLPADTDPEIRERCQGKILPGNIVRILHPQTGEPLPAGEIGEIATKGPTLMKGYWKMPPERTFDEDGFYRTGDAGSVDPDGTFHWTGRTSDMIKTGGANVSPVEIETELLRHPGLKTSVAVGVPHETLGEMVVVCAIPHDRAVVDEENVREFLRGRIASYKIPRRVLFFREDELSLTGNQKIRTEDLRALASARLAAE